MTSPHNEHNSLPEPHEPAHVDFDVNAVEGNEVNRSTIPAATQLLIALGLLGALFGISYLPWINTRSLPPTAVEQSLRTANSEHAASVTTVPEPDIEATSAFIWDVRHQRSLFNKNASAELPLASLTKLMTSLVALETLGPDARVPMTLEAILQDGPSDFTDGETFSAHDLSTFSLVSSSNDGAYALAAAASLALHEGVTTTLPFVNAMNERAKELGLTQTTFNNPTGLDQTPRESGGYGSARDMAFLVEYLIKKRPEIVLPSASLHASVYGSTPHTATNTNEIVSTIPGLLASKTGYTDLAGGNLVIAFDAGLDRPIVITVLGSSRTGRFSDMHKLISYAQAKITEGRDSL